MIKNTTNTMKFPFTEGTVMSVIQWKIRNGALATIATRGHLLTSTANVQLSEKKKQKEYQCAPF
jgi:hypothetical protein